MCIIKLYLDAAICEMIKFIQTSSAITVTSNYESEQYTLDDIMT